MLCEVGADWNCFCGPVYAPFADECICSCSAGEPGAFTTLRPAGSSDECAAHDGESAESAAPEGWRGLTHVSTGKCRGVGSDELFKPQSR